MLRCFAFLLLMLLASVVRSELLNVATDDWEEFSNQDDTGYYIEILKAVYEPLGSKLNIIHVPFGRSLLMLKNGNADIVLGVGQSDLPADYVASSFPIEQDTVDAAYLPESFPEWNGATSLVGKTVVARIDYNYGEILGPKVIYTEKTSLVGMLQMLIKKRVDAVIDFEADIRKAMKDRKITQPIVIKKAVIILPAYFAFGLDKKGHAARAQFESAMPELIRSGKLKTLFLKIDNTLDGYPYP